MQAKGLPAAVAECAGDELVDMTALDPKAASPLTCASQIEKKRRKRIVHNVP